MRRLLEAIEQERQLGDEERRAAHDEKGKASGKGSRPAAPFVPSQVVAADADADAVALADIVAGNPRGLLLWRDESAALIGGGEEEGDGHRAAWRAAWEARASPGRARGSPRVRSGISRSAS
jgi:hypothetical protein